MRNAPGPSLASSRQSATESRLISFTNWLGLDTINKKEIRCKRRGPAHDVCAHCTPGNAPVLSKNLVWAFKSCLIPTRKIIVLQESRKYFFLEFSDLLDRITKKILCKIRRKILRIFPNKSWFVPRNSATSEGLYEVLPLQSPMFNESVRGGGSVRKEDGREGG